MAAHRMTFDAVSDDGLVIAGQPLKYPTIRERLGTLQLLLHSMLGKKRFDVRFNVGAVHDAT